MEDSRILELMVRFAEAHLKSREITVSLKSGQEFKGNVVGVSVFRNIGPHAFMRGVFVGKEGIGTDILVIDFEKVVDDEPRNHYIT